MSAGDNTPEPLDTIEMAALRQYVYRAAGNPDPDTTNVVEAARQAAERMDDLDERLSAIEGATGVNLENAAFKQLSRPGKVKKVRDALKQKAEDNNGKAALDYNEVNALFNYQASPGHAVDLAKAAAGYDDTTETATRDGYDYHKRTDANNRVVVDLEKL